MHRMKNHIFAAALLFAATPMVLTSCSKKNPYERQLDAYDKVAEILVEVTPDNADSMVKKLEAIEEDIPGIMADMKDAPKPDKELMKRGGSVLKKVLGAGIAHKMKWRKAEDREKLRAFDAKMKEVMTKLKG